MLNILTLTTLYPNAEMPAHGIFVENRLRHLRETGDVDNRVIAPVPRFPLPHRIFGRYGTWARVPRVETRYGTEIIHPRYLVIPKIGMNRQPEALYRAFRKSAAELMNEGFRPDVLDAHYFYPDGVAAARLADDLDLPLVITARGTDINLIPEWPVPRQAILAAAGRADRIITVCRALKEALTAMGVPRSKISVLRNGVDLEMFQPQDREAARRQFDVSEAERVVLSVGHLIERKGHNYVIEAMAAFPEVTLLIAGAGPEEDRLKTLTRTLGLQDRVRFLGALPHADLPMLYAAGDALVLASSREGWANVLLEAMACGTPVVATDIWGTGEVVTTPEAGLLVPEQSAFHIAEGLRRLFGHMPSRGATRRYAEQFGWAETTHGQIEIFRRLARKAEAAEQSPENAEMKGGQ